MPVPFAGNVQVHEARNTTRRRDFRHDSFAVSIAQIADSHPGALGRNESRGGRAQPLGGSADEGDFSAKPARAYAPGCCVRARGVAGLGHP